MSVAHKLHTTLFLALVIFAIGVSHALTTHAETAVHNPIVIIPGIGSSYNWNILRQVNPAPSLDNWRFTSGVHQYDQLIQALEDKGLIRDKDFFIAFYDWRQNNLQSVNDYLIPTIDKAIATSTTGKVDIVAHSMGGLVARAYIQSSLYRDDVDRLILLGTPNFGSGDVYTLWEGGLIPSNWDKGTVEVLSRYLWYMIRVTAFTSDNYDTIHLHVPSVKELLPTYNYLVDNSTGLTTLSDEMVEKNIFLQTLNLSSKLDLLASRADVTVIAGKGEPTVGHIYTWPHIVDYGKLWVDGKPDPIIPAQNDTQGDNRVLTQSALLPSDSGGPMVSYAKPTLWEKLKKVIAQVAEAQIILPKRFHQFSISSTHGNLPTNAIPDILTLLDFGTTDAVYAPIAETRALLTFWFASPVEVTVTDPSGHSITRTASELPNAYYEGATDPLGAKFITIEEPASGEYTIALHGLADGHYYFATAYFADTGDVVKTVERDIAKGETLVYRVTLDGTATSSPFTVSEPEVVVHETNPAMLLSSLIEDVRNQDFPDRVERTLTHFLHKALKDVGHVDEDDGVEGDEDKDDEDNDGDEHNTTKAYKKAGRDVERFIFFVERYRNAGRIDGAVAENLTAQAQTILDILGLDTSDEDGRHNDGEEYGGHGEEDRD